MKEDPRLGSLLAGYRIESLLGRGGMSVVYLAQHERLKRKAALKVLAPQLAEDDTFRSRFITESELAASLDHPNVIPIFEAGEAEGVLYIAMRYVPSTDLRALLQTRGRLSPGRTVSIVSQVASALDAAHALGLVHRDVKPGNILVAEGQGSGGTDHVYLSDFGLTKRTESGGGLTRTGQFVGTPGYVAPEQIEGRSLDGRTDQYSLAVVMFECLAGRLPYAREQDLAILMAHLRDAPPSLAALRPDLPREVDAVMARALSKQKEARYPDCATFVGYAAAALKSEPHPGSGALTATQATPTAEQATEAALGPPDETAAATPVAPTRAAPSPAPVQAPPGPVPAPAAPPLEPAPAAPPGPPPRTGRRRRRGWLSGVGAAAVVGGVILGVVLAGRGGTTTSTTPPGGCPGGRSTAAPGAVIFSDAFGDRSGQWDETSTDASTTGYVSGAYRILLKRKGGLANADAGPHVPGVQCLGDVRVSADVTKVVGGGNSTFGIACRRTTGTNEYYFVIRANGAYAIEKGGTQLKVSSTPQIKQGNATNHLEAECSGGAGSSPVTLKLWVNGVLVDSVEDPTDSFSVGSVGVTARGPAGLDIRFDNFQVKQA
jgi:hypothetical protein